MSRASKRAANQEAGWHQAAADGVLVVGELPDLRAAARSPLSPDPWPRAPDPYPIATMRSIASRARAAIASGTVIRNSRFSRESRIFSRSIIFMNSQ